MAALTVAIEAFFVTTHRLWAVDVDAVIRTDNAYGIGFGNANQMTSFFGGFVANLLRAPSRPTAYLLSKREKTGFLRGTSEETNPLVMSARDGYESAQARWLAASRSRDVTNRIDRTDARRNRRR